MSSLKHITDYPYQKSAKTATISPTAHTEPIAIRTDPPSEVAVAAALLVSATRLALLELGVRLVDEEIVFAMDAVDAVELVSSTIVVSTVEEATVIV